MTPKDPDPYQELLGEELRRLGVAVDYLHGPTPSLTLNLLLSPLQLAVRRVGGYRVLHLHWVYDWLPSWAARSEAGRRLSEVWLLLILRWASLLGYRLVWTAHNVYPHDRTFHDDAAARRRMVALMDAVIVHAAAAGEEVRSLGAQVVSVIAAGSHLDCYPPGPDRSEARARLGLLDEGLVALHLGALRPYKGADRLLAAVAAGRPKLTLVMAGACGPSMRSHLQRLATACGGRARLHAAFVPPEEVRAYLAAADVGVFAFRSVTNSSSVALALDAGLPVLVPDIPAFDDLPAGAVLRFDGTDAGLAEALVELGGRTREQLSAMGAVAKTAGRNRSWARAARQTLQVYEGATAVTRQVAAADG